jgi:hypothetical protein
VAAAAARITHWVWRVVVLGREGTSLLPSDHRGGEEVLLCATIHFLHVVVRTETVDDVVILLVVVGVVIA